MKSTGHATKAKVTIDPNLEFTGSGNGLKLKKPANGRMATAILVADTATVADRTDRGAGTKRFRPLGVS